MEHAVKLRQKWYAQPLNITILKVRETFLRDT